jgi:hypothetical protein
MNYWEKKNKRKEKYRTKKKKGRSTFSTSSLPITVIFGTNMKAVFRCVANIYPRFHQF